MEQIYFPASHRTKFVLLCLLGMSIAMVQSNTIGITPPQQPLFPPREIKFTLYVQQTLNLPNATAIPVAGVQGEEFNVTNFGTIFVLDNKVTEVPDRNAPEIARLEGLLAAANVQGLNLYDSYTIIFTSGRYKGSTFQVQGIDVLAQPIKEVAVVSGTGQFRFVSGYIVFSFASSDPTLTFVTSTLNVTLRYQS